jgi:phosphoribosylformylglycinamidine (FGAM) synthase-like enzyme
LRDMCLSYGIPLLSGKDSMYVDGHLTGRYGETHKVSALESLQFSATSVIPNIDRCVTLDAKMPDDLVYVLGVTRNELGGSEYYDGFGYVGCNVPRVIPETFMHMYRALSAAINDQCVASAHGIYRGGLGVHLAMVAMAGGLGLRVALAALPAQGVTRDDVALYSESAGRFIVTVNPADRSSFEAHFQGMPMACVGTVTKEPHLTITGRDGQTIIDTTVPVLKNAWQQTFGDLI